MCLMLLLLLYFFLFLLLLLFFLFFPFFKNRKPNPLLVYLCIVRGMNKGHTGVWVPTAGT